MTTDRIAQLERERDALLEALRESFGYCKRLYAIQSASGVNNEKLGFFLARWTQIRDALAKYKEMT